MHFCDKEFKVIVVVQLAYYLHMEICIFYVRLTLHSLRDCHVMKINLF